MSFAVVRLRRRQTTEKGNLSTWDSHHKWWMCDIKRNVSIVVDRCVLVVLIHLLEERREEERKSVSRRGQSKRENDRRAHWSFAVVY